MKPVADSQEPSGIVESPFILSDYLDAAMDRADYEKLEDSSYAGRIPACPGVIAFADTLATCQRQLRSTLEDWLWLGLRLGHGLPVIDDHDLNRDTAHAELESV
jgi:predicted RNase H-like HicB family nuclease